MCVHMHSINRLIIRFCKKVNIHISQSTLNLLACVMCVNVCVCLVCVRVRVCQSRNVTKYFYFVTLLK